MVLHDGMGPAVVLPLQPAAGSPDRPSRPLWTLSAKDVPGLVIRVRRWWKGGEVFVELVETAAPLGRA